MKNKITVVFSAVIMVGEMQIIWMFIIRYWIIQ